MPFKPLSIFGPHIVNINKSSSADLSLFIYQVYYNSCVYKLGQLRTASCLRTSSEMTREHGEGTQTMLINFCMPYLEIVVVKNC